MQKETREIVNVINKANRYYTGVADGLNLRYLRHMVIADEEQIQVYEEINDDPDAFIEDFEIPSKYHELVYKADEAWENYDGSNYPYELDDELLEMFLSNVYAKRFYELAEKTELGFETIVGIYLSYIFDTDSKGTNVTADEIDKWVREYLN